MDKECLIGMIAADNSQLLSISVELTTVKEEEPSWPKRLANMVSACGCGETASNSSDSFGFSKAYECILKPNHEINDQPIRSTAWSRPITYVKLATRHRMTRAVQTFLPIVRYRFAIVQF